MNQRVFQIFHRNLWLWFGSTCVFGFLLALGRLWLMTNDVYRKTLILEEGYNFWYFAREFSFWENLRISDFNAVPLVTRTIAYALVKVVGLHGEFPLAFKVLAQTYLCLCAFFLLHPKFKILPWICRLAIALFVIFYPGGDLFTSYNASYGSAILGIVTLYFLSENQIQNRTYLWLLALPLVCFSKSLVIFLVIPAFLLAAYCFRLGNRHRLIWALALLIFFFGIQSVLYFSRFLGETPASIFTVSKGFSFFTTLGVATLGFAPMTLSVPYAGNALLVQAITSLCLVVGVLAFGLNLYGLKKGFSESKRDWVLVSGFALIAPACFFSLLRMHVHQGFNLGAVLYLTPEKLVSSEWGVLISRHIFLIAVSQMMFFSVMIFHNISSPRRRGFLWASYVSFFVISSLYFRPQPSFPPEQSTFIRNVFETIPIASPSRYCFPLTGFPFFNVEHHCFLFSKTARLFRFRQPNQSHSIRLPSKTNAIVARHQRGASLENLRIWINGKQAHAIEDRGTSLYRYYWLDGNGVDGEVTLENLGPGELPVEIFFYTPSRPPWKLPGQSQIEL